MCVGYENLPDPANLIAKVHLVSGLEKELFRTNSNAENSLFCSPPWQKNPSQKCSDLFFSATLIYNGLLSRCWHVFWLEEIYIFILILQVHLLLLRATSHVFYSSLPGRALNICRNTDLCLTDPLFQSQYSTMTECIWLSSWRCSTSAEQIYMSVIIITALFSPLQLDLPHQPPTVPVLRCASLIYTPEIS